MDYSVYCSALYCGDSKVQSGSPIVSHRRSGGGEEEGKEGKGVMECRGRDATTDSPILKAGATAAVRPTNQSAPSLYLTIIRLGN